MTQLTDREALAYIADLGHQAFGVEVVGVPDLRKVLVRNGAEIVLHDMAPEPRRIEVHSVADLVRLTVSLGEGAEVYHEGAESPADMKSGVAFDGGAIRVVLNAVTRVDLAMMRLRPSDLFMQLVALAKTGTMKLPAAINMLRFQLPVEGIDGLVSKLRKVDFKSTRTVGVETDHGRESMGMALEREVVQAADIPDGFTVSVPLYSNDAMLRELSTVDIKMGLYLDCEAEGVRIQPLADEIDSASAAVQAKLATALREALGDAAPVFHGCPAAGSFMALPKMAPVIRSSAVDGGGGCGVR